MLDLETLASSPRAAICAIGAVRFDLNELKLGEEFYRVIDLVSLKKFGFEFDPETFYWWMEQGQEARKIFDKTTEKVGIKKALAEFTYFVKASDDSVPLIWGNGASFDNVILSHAYEICGNPRPWSHKQDVCYRTIRKMFPHTAVEEGVAHNALQDAKNQALTMIQIFSAFKGEFIP
jgi:exodeoxyribonuclease VIII